MEENKLYQVDFQASIDVGAKDLEELRKIIVEIFYDCDLLNTDIISIKEIEEEE